MHRKLKSSSLALIRKNNLYRSTASLRRYVLDILTSRCWHIIARFDWSYSIPLPLPAYSSSIIGHKTSRRCPARRQTKQKINGPSFLHPRSQVPRSRSRQRRHPTSAPTMTVAATSCEILFKISRTSNLVSRRRAITKCASRAAYKQARQSQGQRQAFTPCFDPDVPLLLTGML